VILTAGNDQMHVWRQVLEQKGEDIVNRLSSLHGSHQDQDEIVRIAAISLIRLSESIRLSVAEGLEHSQRPCSNICPPALAAASATQR